jgi:hypothetical protein
MEDNVSISEMILRPFARRVHVVGVDGLRGFDPQFEIAQIVRSGLRDKRRGQQKNQQHGTDCAERMNPWRADSLQHKDTSIHVLKSIFVHAARGGM